MLVRIFKVLNIITVILGSTAAVEQIFSGGRDTILLCRANLKPDIHTLMHVKQCLHLAHEAILDASIEVYMAFC